MPVFGALPLKHILAAFQRFRSSSRGLYRPRSARPFLEPLARSHFEKREGEVSRASKFATCVNAAMVILRQSLTQRRRAISPPRHPLASTYDLQRLRSPSTTPSVFASIQRTLNWSPRDRSQIKCSSLFSNELMQRIKAQLLQASQNFKIRATE